MLLQAARTAGSEFCARGAPSGRRPDLIWLTCWDLPVGCAQSYTATPSLSRARASGWHCRAELQVMVERGEQGGGGRFGMRTVILRIIG